MYLVLSYGVRFKVLSFNQETKKYKCHRIDKSKDDTFDVKLGGDIQFIVAENLNDARLIKSQMKKDFKAIEDKKDIDLVLSEEDSNGLISYNGKDPKTHLYWRDEFNSFLKHQSNRLYHIHELDDFIKSKVKINTPFNNPRYIDSRMFIYSNYEKDGNVDGRRIKRLNREIMVFDEKSDEFYITKHLTEDNKNNFINFFQKSKYNLSKSIKIKEDLFTLCFKKSKPSLVFYF